MDPLLSDPLYLFRLYKRLNACLISRGGGSVTHTTLQQAPPPLKLSHLFVSIDQRFRDLTVMMPVEEVLEEIRPLFTASSIPSSSMFIGGGRSANQQHTNNSAVITPRDLQLLRELLPLEELSASPQSSDGGGIMGVVAPGEVLFALLQLVPQHAYLLDHAIQQVRRAVSGFQRRPNLEDLLYRTLSEGREYGVSSGSTPSVVGKHVIAFLVVDCGLTISHALMIAQYCMIPGSISAVAPDEEDYLPGIGDAQEENGQQTPLARIALLRAALDADLVYRLCFEDGPIDRTVAYPLLAMQFSESAAEPYASSSFGNTSGSTFLIAVLDHLTASLTGGRVGGGEGTSALPPLDRRWIDEAQFRQLCWLLGTPSHVIEPLFDCLADGRSGRAPGGSEGNPQGRVAPISRIMNMFFQYFPSKGPSMVELCRSAFVLCMKKKQKTLIFIELFDSLRKWGVKPIPIPAYVQALRQCLVGVTDGRTSATSAFADVDLESLRCLGTNRIALLRALTYPVPASRLAVITKACQYFDDGLRQKAAVSSGRRYVDMGNTAAPPLTAELVFHSFSPEKIEGAVPRRDAVQWKTALKIYLEEISGCPIQESSHLQHARASPLSTSDTTTGSIITTEELTFYLEMVSAGVEDDPTFTMMIWQGFGMADSVSRVTRKAL